MRFNLAEFNWPLIIMIAAISATMSYVGDILGKKIGKKRISIFRLRPKYTSTLVTIFTGTAVALLTLVVATYSSDSVKMAVFGPNIMERRMTELTNQLGTRQRELDDTTVNLVASQSELSRKEREKSAVEAEVAALRKETDDLRRGLAEMKSGRVVVFQGEMLAQAPIEPDGGGHYALDEAIGLLVTAAEGSVDAKLAGSAGSDSRHRAKVIVTDEMRAGVEKVLGSSSGRKVLRLTAPSNIVDGQVLEGVVTVFDSNLLFGEGEVLMSESVSGVSDNEEGGNILYTMLTRVNRMVVSKGVLPDPISGKVGNLDILDFYDVVDRIVADNKDGGISSVIIKAAEDIYTEGPVNVRIEVEKEAN
jgi:uncharacterized protein (DUF3084 family)